MLYAAENNAAPPWEVIEDQLCERYHCLPWELDGQDVGRLLRNARLRNMYDIASKSHDAANMSESDSATLGYMLTLELEHGE